MAQENHKVTGDSPEEAEEAGFPLTHKFVSSVLKALKDNDLAQVRALLEPLHAADLADLLGLVSADQRRDLIELLRQDLDPDLLAELDPAVRDDVIEQLEPSEVAAAVSEMETDEAVYVLEDLEEGERRAVLENIPAEERAAVEVSLSYPEDSAGRLMQRDLIAVPAFWTVGQTIDYMRETADLPDEFYEIFVVDPKHHPIGTVPLSRIMRAKRPVIVSDIMTGEPHLLRADTDQEEVAYLFKQYGLMSAGVINEDGRLIGVIMVDDVVDVIEEEAEEDILRLGGVSDADFNESIFEITRTRFIWLMVNLATAVLASTVIAQFGATIQQMVALAVLMPIVASMGGNAGTQALTVAVRNLATRELTWTNAMRAISKEVIVGAINGGILAIVIGFVGAIWFDNVNLGLVLGAAMIINILVAALAGILVPLGLERAGIDPAVASGVFVTTITDVVGFLAFLGLAAWFLL
jgi:magnesium transporter